ncbi:hypothetical protein [Streptosporangium sp. NPDC050280]|uniref:hypothetical protein n=1 Tax=Streptosporangium TaxID=2000 RepID=UPI00343E928B
MRAQALEARVLALVEKVLGGSSVEDSLVECKADWPGEEKARQLAGHANSSQGEPIIWIIGLDEKAHRVSSRDPGIDLAIWWDKIRARFDEGIAPNMVQSLVVPVGEGTSVLALAFETDRAPYVVKALTGNVERDVPVRKGTATRSANRSDLIRMLTPVMRLPEVSVVHASGNVRRFEGGATAHERLEIGFAISLFLYSPGDGATVFPKHLMRGEIELSDKSSAVRIIEVAPYYHGMSKEERSNQPRYGVLYYNDAAFLVGAGELQLRVQAKLDPLEDFGIEDYGKANLTLSLPVAGSSRPLRVSVELHKSMSRFPTVMGIEEIISWSF